MRAAMIRLALLAFLLSGVAQAAMIQYGDPGYEALQTASNRVGNRGWVADRLQKSQPLSEMVAKEEAKMLLLNRHLDPVYRKALEDAFPTETKPVEQKYVQIDSRMQALDDKISTVTSKLDRFEAGMRDGLLSGRSRPSLLGSLGGTMASAGNLHGPGKIRGWERGLGGSGIWTEWSLADDGFLLTWVMEFYDGYIDFRDAHLGLAFDNVVLPGIEMTIADENNYPALSLLIFNGGGDGYDDDFNDMRSLSGRKELIKSGAGYGARGGQDIYIRRKSEGDWWPFSDTQFVASQTYNYFYDHILNDVVANFKIRGMPMFWPFERADPAITTLWSFNDTAEINSYGNKTVPDNSSAQSFAVNMLLVGGGTFFLEAATAEWERSNVTKDYRDFSVSTVISKSIGKAAVVLDYQHTGPDYFPGTQEEPSGNAASSFTLDDRPGQAGLPAWKTVASEPSGPSTNSEHLAVGTTFDLTSASLGFTLGTNVQIEPSGPWLTSRHMIGWSWDRFSDDHGDHRTGITKNGAALMAGEYNNAYPSTIAIADSKGNTMSVDWTKVDDGNRERIVLTQNGVGDAHLRADSIKYVNFIDLRGDINFQSLFDLERPCLLKLASRIRNTGETFAIPAYDDKSFLMQIASSATFNVSLPGKMQVVTAVGYEDWLSKASYLPIEYHTSWAYLEYDKDFPQFLSDFSVGPNISILNHHDPNSSQRDFSVWNMGIGASTTF
jgi:hypothetical protein